MPLHSTQPEIGEELYDGRDPYTIQFYKHLHDAKASKSEIGVFTNYEKATDLANSYLLNISVSEWFNVNNIAKDQALIHGVDENIKKFTLITADLCNLIEPLRLPDIPRLAQLKRLTGNGVWPKIDEMSAFASFNRDMHRRDEHKSTIGDIPAFDAQEQFLLNYNAIRCSKDGRVQQPKDYEETYAEYYIRNCIHFLQKYGIKEIAVAPMILRNLHSEMCGLSNVPIDIRRFWHQSLLSFVENTPGFSSYMKNVFQIAENSALQQQQLEQGDSKKKQLPLRSR
jgi:hypothetical protein